MLLLRYNLFSLTSSPHADYSIKLQTQCTPILHRIACSSFSLSIFVFFVGVSWTGAWFKQRRYTSHHRALLILLSRDFRHRRRIVVAERQSSDKSSGTNKNGINYGRSDSFTHRMKSETGVWLIQIHVIVSKSRQKMSGKKETETEATGEEKKFVLPKYSRSAGCCSGAECSNAHATQ